jgi:hypothetical protein
MSPLLVRCRGAPAKVSYVDEWRRNVLGLPDGEPPPK